MSLTSVTGIHSLGRCLLRLHFSDSSTFWLFDSFDFSLVLILDSECIRIVPQCNIYVRIYVYMYVYMYIYTYIFKCICIYIYRLFMSIYVGFSWMYV